MGKMVPIPSHVHREPRSTGARRPATVSRCARGVENYRWAVTVAAGRWTTATKTVESRRRSARCRRKRKRSRLKYTNRRRRRCFRSSASVLALAQLWASRSIRVGFYTAVGLLHGKPENINITMCKSTTISVTRG